MISDVLSDAANEISRYLDDPLYESVYTPRMRVELRVLVDEMERVRKLLDTTEEHLIAERSR